MMESGEEGSPGRKKRWRWKQHDMNPVVTEETVSGYLLKMSNGKWNKTNWHHRWFVLNKTDGILLYYKRRPKDRLNESLDRTSSSTEKRIRGIYHLRQPGVSLVLDRKSLKTASDFFFQISHNNSTNRRMALRLCTSSSSNLATWTKAIGQIVQSNPTGAAPNVDDDAAAASYSSSDSDSAEDSPAGNSPQLSRQPKVSSPPPQRTESTAHRLSLDPEGVTRQVSVGAQQKRISVQNHTRVPSTIPQPEFLPQPSNHIRQSSDPLSPDPDSSGLSEQHRSSSWFKKKLNKTEGGTSVIPTSKYLNPGGNTEPGTGSGLLCGYLHKSFIQKYNKKGAGGRWHRRWFVLDIDGRCLYYYKNSVMPYNKVHRSDARGWMDLSRAGTAIETNNTGRQPTNYGFQLTFVAPGHLRGDLQILSLCALSEKEYKQWVKALTDAINSKKEGSAPGHTPTRSSSKGKHRSRSTHSEPKFKVGGGRTPTTPKNVTRGIALIVVNIVALLLGYGGSIIFFLTLMGCNAAAWVMAPRLTKPPPPMVAPRVELSDDEEASDDSEEETEADKSGNNSTPNGSMNGPPKVKRDVPVANKKAKRPIGNLPNTGSSNCWTPVKGDTFNVRIGPDYKRNKQKAPSQGELLTPHSVDIFRTQKKVDHIARYMDLPPIEPGGHMIVINVQLPGYPPENPMWGEKVTDGIGYSFVSYFPISASLIEQSKQAQGGALELLNRWLHADSKPNPDEVYDRFKVIGRLANQNDPNLNFSGYLSKMVESYNGKPVLTRPQHVIYHCGSYTEIDINVHAFGFVARRGLSGFFPKLKLMQLDTAFVLEGHTDEELPEVVLGCLRLNKVDFEAAKQW